MTRLFFLAVITIAASLAPVAASHAQGESNTEAEAVARAYMALYSSVDWDGMEALLAEDVRFRDTTAESPDVGPDGYAEDSRDGMMAELRAFGESYNPIELGFEWDQVFTSNSRVVFIGHVNALYPTDTPGQNFRWRSEQVTVITVRDGLVVSHQDFANYAHPEQGLIAATDAD
ncbi:nuclear transport factor 2 family protein [Maricaulis sp.]|uniref:nuclear transport factor 2 family protein n=1 Tax=Maricaulis sp. TaxID=1486257 RepID=UPI003A8F9484